MVKIHITKKVNGTFLTTMDGNIYIPSSEVVPGRFELPSSDFSQRGVTSVADG